MPGSGPALKPPQSLASPALSLPARLPAPAPSLMPMPQAYPASGPVPAAAQPPNAPQQVSVQVGPVKSPLLWPGLAVCGWATGPTLQGVHGARAAEVEMWACVAPHVRVHAELGPGGRSLGGILFDVTAWCDGAQDSRGYEAALLSSLTVPYEKLNEVLNVVHMLVEGNHTDTCRAFVERESAPPHPIHVLVGTGPESLMLMWFIMGSSVRR